VEVVTPATSRSSSSFSSSSASWCAGGRGLVPNDPASDDLATRRPCATLTRRLRAPPTGVCLQKEVRGTTGRTWLAMQDWLGGVDRHDKEKSGGGGGRRRSSSSLSRSSCGGRSGVAGGGAALQQP
jgi:hypothetical protein